MRFKDREEAGRRLAAALPQFSRRPDTAVWGLTRGGVPVAAALAEELQLPFSALPVRKLGVPSHEETAFGALAWFSGSVVRILNRPFMARLLELGIAPSALEQVESDARTELRRQVAGYPGFTHDAEGKTAILADDGLATGASMRAAVEAVRGAGAAAVIVAVPVASLHAQNSLEQHTDGVFSLHLPGRFRAVGSYYRTFEQVQDADVMRLLGEQTGRAAD
ncbi:MAG: phosphoribosyl transferase [Arthrobacter sp.]|nr:phosphoribosyl transferase [Arthrobacter sp.]